MKFTIKFTAAFASLGLLAAVAQEPVKFTIPGGSQPAAPAKTPAATPAAPAAPVAPMVAPAASAASVKFTEVQLLEAYGYVFAMRSGLANEVQALEFSPAQREAMARGIATALSGKDLGVDQAQVPQLQAQIQELLKPKHEAFTAKREAALTQMRLKNIADGNTFFTKLAENKAVVSLPSGLRYEILKPATGAAAKAGQVATIHYTGSLINGEVFDSSLQAPQPGQPPQPVELPVVAATRENPAGIIPGMAEGLQKVGVGGKARFYIPPSLAYGDSGNEAIPPGSTLVFEIEVIGVKDMPKEAAK